MAGKPRRSFLGLTLSDREKQVLTKLAEGATYADIAGHLEIGESTVRKHVSNIFRKLKAKNAAHAVAIAFGKNLIFDEFR